MNRETAAKILDHTLRNGGGTFTIAYGTPTVLNKGYVVAMNRGTFRTSPVDEPEMAIEGIRDTDNGNYFGYIGTWIDGNTIHIDRVAIFDSLSIAKSVAKHFKQLAIWDLAKSEEIRV